MVGWLGGLDSCTKCSPSEFSFSPDFSTNNEHTFCIAIRQSFLMDSFFGRHRVLIYKPRLANRLPISREVRVRFFFFVPHR